MRRDETTEILAGLAAILGFVAILFLSYTANTESARLRGDAYRLAATFNRVNGVAPGAQVQVSGIAVGGVESMTLLPDYRARVVMRIDVGVSLPDDSSAAIQTDGLFGNKFISIEPGGSETTLGPDAVISFTQDAVVVSELLDLIISEGNAARDRETRRR